MLVACHIDEIGFYVRHVDDKGFMRIQNTGGFDTRNLLARRVLVQASSGEDLSGLMNPRAGPFTSPRKRTRRRSPRSPSSWSICACPAEQVKKKVRIGDPVSLVQKFAEIGECVSGKCLDNRVAAFVAIEAVKKAAQLQI